MEFTTNYGWNMPEPTDPVNSSAEYAENMESIDGVVKDIADEVTYVDEGLTALSQTVAGKVNKSGDTMTGALNMSGSKIQNVATPTQGSDAATKAYVDNIAGGEYLKLDGSSTMEGDIAMGGHKVTGLPSSGPVNANDAVPKWYVIEKTVTYEEGLTADLNANNNTISALGTPTFNYDAATKKYVDDNDALNLPLDGGTMSGAISMNGNAIHQLPVTPTYNTDAATKGYVDGFTVTFTLSDSTMTCDKTFAEISAAINNNKFIRMKQKQSGDNRVYYTTSYSYFPNSSITFDYPYNALDGSTELRFIRMASTGTIKYYTRLLS